MLDKSNERMFHATETLEAASTEPWLLEKAQDLWLQWFCQPISTETCTVCASV